MNDTLEIFSSTDTFTLIIGPNRKTLSVARYVLEKIPYFKKALQDDGFKEAKEKIFELPDDDAQAVADVLMFSLTNWVDAIENTDEECGIISGHMRAVSQRYLKAWIVADKFMVEETSNNIADALIEYYKDSFIDPQQVAMLSAHDLHETEMYKLMVRDIAYTLHRDGQKGRPHLMKAWFDDGAEIFARLSRQDLIAIIKAIVTPDKNTNFPTTVASENTCSLHIHHVTERCSSPEAGV